MEKRKEYSQMLLDEEDDRWTMELHNMVEEGIEQSLRNTLQKMVDNGVSIEKINEFKNSYLIDW